MLSRLTTALRTRAATTPVVTPTTGTTSARTATTRASGAIATEPSRPVRFGLVKVTVTVAAGLGAGAVISQKMAAFLEENELFVPDDDDDDDD
jgi:hypothetical protein